MSGGPIIPETPASTTVEPSPAATPLPAEPKPVIEQNVQPGQGLSEQQQVATLQTELDRHVEASDAANPPTNIEGGQQAVQAADRGLLNGLKRWLSGDNAPAEQPKLVPGADGQTQTGTFWDGQTNQAVQTPVVEPAPVVESAAEIPVTPDVAENPASAIAEPLPAVEPTPIVTAQPVAEQPPAEVTPSVEPVNAEKPAEPVAEPAPLGAIAQADIEQSIKKAESEGGTLENAQAQKDAVAEAEQILKGDSQVQTPENITHPAHQIINSMEQAHQEYSQKQTEHLQQLREAVGTGTASSTPTTPTPAV